MPSGGSRWWSPQESRFYVEFGRQVAEARKRLGLALPDLASMVDYSKSSLNGIESGKQAPTAYRYVQMVEVLGLSPQIAGGGAPAMACCEGALMGIEGTHSVGCAREAVKTCPTCGSSVSGS